MPNWVKNNVTFYGNEKDIKRLKKLVSSENNEFDFEKIIPMPEYIYRGNLGREEEQLYGKNNWYDWSVKNWGTKWNTCEPHWESDDSVTFETAWSMPEPIYYKLAELFPEVKFDVAFADEDIGHNCGFVDYDGEDVNVCYGEDFDFACEVWGYDPEEMKEEFGYV